MKNILYFLLLVAIAELSNLFAAGQFKKELNKKFDANESLNSPGRVDDIEIRKKLEQNLQNSVHREDKLKDKFEFYENNAVEFDNLNTEQIQETEDKKVDDISSEEKLQHDESIATKLPDLSKVVCKDEKINKVFPDLNEDSSDKSIDQDTENLLNIAKKKIDKSLEIEPLPLGTSLNDGEVNLPTVNNLQKNLQDNHIKGGESSENHIGQLSKEKKGDIAKVESQVEEKKVKKVSSDSKDHKRKNRAKCITEKCEKDEKDEQSGDKKLQKLRKLRRDTVKEWKHKHTQSKSIYKRQYDSLNEHLPITVFIYDYGKQFFYCTKKSNLSCLRGIIVKLEKLGLNTKEILKFRNKLGDTPIIYAVKQGDIEIVRFLLLQGADFSAVNYKFKSHIDIAIEKKQIDIINVLNEMTPRLLEYSKINNKKDSTMYDLAINTKENNKSKCDEK
ncbi:MAG: hypothetical protein PV345_03580 [Wolbachia sp.]|nr:hypothetical protein [Wolbachia sp.]